MGLDTKTYWLTDRQSQCDFDFDYWELQFWEVKSWQLRPERVRKRSPLEAPTKQRLLKIEKNYVCSSYFL
jgi:hypothetical protein